MNNWMWKKTNTSKHWCLLLLLYAAMRPPRPAYTPSPNGNLFTCDAPATNPRRPPVGSKWQSRLQDMLTPSSSRAYAMGCAIITLLLLTVLLIFYFLGKFKKPYTHATSWNLEFCFIKVKRKCFNRSFSFPHSPAGRRCAAANWGTEAEGSGKHRAFATHPGTAGTQTQLDSTERRDMREPQQNKIPSLTSVNTGLTMKSDANAIPSDSFSDGIILE